MRAEFYELSKRLGTIRHDQLSEACARLGLGELISLEPVPYGLFGQNLFLLTASGEFVFRGAPHAPWQFPTEQFFARTLHDHSSVPAPWPYKIDESCEIFSWSYVIMPRLPGIQAMDPRVKAQLSRSDRLEMAGAMARNLAAMHRVTAPACGRFDPALNAVRPVPIADEAAWPFHGTFGEVSSAPAFHEIVEARIRLLLERARATNDHTSAEDGAWVEEILEKRSSAIQASFVPCLVMEDYQEGNVVFSRTAAGWEISGVFDLMGCYFGDGEADLSRTAAMYLDESTEVAREFLRSYLRQRPLRPGFGERFVVYMILDRLIIWEYMERHEPEVARRLGSLRAWAGRYASMIDSLGLNGASIARP